MLKKFCMVFAVCALQVLPGRAFAEIVDFSEIADLDASADIPEHREKIPVSRGDTIWSIARVHRSAGASIEQMALALYFSNPDAFAGHSINRLITGTWLNVPPTVIFTQVSPSDAKELLDKLRSNSSYDAQTLLHQLKKHKSTPTPTRTLPSSANTLSIKLPTPMAATQKAPPATNSDKTNSAPTATPQISSSTPAKDNTQLSTRLEREPIILPTVAPVPVLPAATAEVPKTVAASTPEADATPAAVELSSETVALDDDNGVGGEQASACVSETCRMVLDLKNRMIAIQSELSQLNSNIAAGQASSVGATGRKTAVESGKIAEQSHVEPSSATAETTFQHTWHSITALHPIALGSIVLAGAMLQLLLGLLIKLGLSLRKPREASPAASPPLPEKTVLPAAAQEYRSEPPPFQPQVEERLKKFEPVILAEVDEIEELPIIVPKPQATTAATSAPVLKKRIEKRDNALDTPVSRSGTTRKPKAAVPQEINFSKPKTARTAPVKTAVDKTARPSQTEQLLDSTDFGKDDLSLDFGLQDGLQDGKLHH